MREQLSISHFLEAEEDLMHTKTILLVEDNPDDRELIRLALQQADIPCKVETVFDGAKLAYYLFAVGEYCHRDARQMPDLILLDLKLPKLSGCKALQRLQRVRGRPNLPPVIVFTSSDDEQDIADAYSAGANSYIRKPVDFNEFIEKIRQVLLYWLDLNVPPPSRLRVAPSLFT